MRHWFADDAFRAILRNASNLGSSQLAGALMGLVALAFAGRGLSPALIGTLAVI